MQLTKNFNIKEFVNTSHCEFLIRNETCALKHLFELTQTAALLQKVRDQFGPITITSGIRCEELNKKIGGATNSQHLKGEAADFVSAAGVLPLCMFIWIGKNLKFGQCIYENHNGKEWIHLSTGDKCEMLTFKNGVYKKWQEAL